MVRRLLCTTPDAAADAVHVADGVMDLVLRGCLDLADPDAFACAGMPPCAMATDTRPAADSPLPCWRLRPRPFETLDCAQQLVVEQVVWSPGETDLRCTCP